MLFTSGRRTVLAEHPEPEPTPGKVLVDVDLTGICGSDLHAADLEVYTAGHILGHEVAGRVRSVGEGVSGWRPGMRVAINPNGNICGTCRWCRAGQFNHCVRATQETAVGMQQDGGLAPRLLLAASTLRVIPEEMGRVEAAWVEPAATALRAVRLAGDVGGRTILVTGGGPIGQLVIRLLRQAGAGRIVLSEPSPERRRFGAASGADEVLSPAEMPEGLAVDAVIECSGNAGATRQAVGALEPRGTLVVVGAGPGSGLDPATILFKELVVRGSFTYVSEFDDVIPMLADNRLPVADLTTEVVPLSGALDAIASLRQASTMKVLVDPAL
ncbi:zinc-dependent alcohol dehydrogenase [Paractinoplanes toevensis]|uniref:zinc-dependent alcohol dehydrogenase n=1 Tax=Paractinoplanes toevensis TaxID=571911 RepID=UPI001BB31AE5|nr:alcohol dehydrogenase catalytic domain-containing protein [Actinoplanes toevensis]